MDRNALSRATDTSDSPTPGYLYVDLSRIVSSNPNAAKDTASFLLTRLRHKNHNAKFKSLRLIMKLAAVHPPYFQRSITINPEFVAEIKQHLQYRGPPDPMRGDEIYSRVRNVAQECLDALYREPEKPVENNGGSYAANSGASTSMPSQYGNQYGNAGAAGGGGPGRMQGFGSHPDPRLAVQESKYSLQKVTKLASDIGGAVVGMIKDPLAKNATPVSSQSRIGSYNPGSGQQNASYSGPGGGGGFSGGGMSASYGNKSASSGGWGASPPGRSQLAASTGGQWTMASNRGQNAVRPPASMGSWNASAAPVPSSTQVAATGVPTGPVVVNTVSKVKSDGSYERYLIGELCPASGLYAAPDDSKMTQFKGIVGGLEVDLICPPLLDLLENDMWQVKGKALHVIHLLVTLAGELGESYKTFFYECRYEIEPLAHHAKLAVRDPASKVLKLLGITAAAMSKPTPKASAPEENLLDLDSPDKAPRSTSSENEGLISGAPIAAPTSSEDDGNFFGGLTQKKTSVTVEKSSETTADIFAEMSLNDTSKVETSDTNNFAPSSGFGFMNSSKAPVATSIPNEQAPAVTSKSSVPLDSLLSLSAPTPNSATSSTFINPTAAYQQQMAMPPPAHLQMNPQMMNISQVPNGMMPAPHHSVMLQGGAGHYFHLDVPEKKKDDKSFDFVKDVVKSAK